MTVAIPDNRRSETTLRGWENLAHRCGGRARRLSERTVAAVTATVLALGAGWSLWAGNAELDMVAVAVVVAALSLPLLSLRWMLALESTAALCLGLVSLVEFRTEHWSQPSVPALVLAAGTVLVGSAGVLRAHRRDRLGLRRVSAETVLGLIRDRTVVQAEVPSVPGWTVDIQHRPAHGAVLSGDFVANRLVRNGDRQVLHLAVIDVAGCGITAGPRALLLSGAVGGLLGTVPAEEFLAAVNDYLARQQGSVGLASAVYLQLDLDSGEYLVRVAGHPPALHYRPGAPSRWRTSVAAGTVLGALPSVTGVLDRAVLQPGEALFLYTDGVVEDRAAGLEAGTRRLMGSVEALAGGRPPAAGLAGLLIEQVPSTLADDRTLVVIQREPAELLAAREPVASPAAERPPAADPSAGRLQAGRREPGRLLPVGS